MPPRLEIPVGLTSQEFLDAVASIAAIVRDLIDDSYYTQPRPAGTTTDEGQGLTIDDLFDDIDQALAYHSAEANLPSPEKTQQPQGEDA